MEKVDFYNIVLGSLMVNVMRIGDDLNTTGRKLLPEIGACFDFIAADLEDSWDEREQEAWRNAMRARNNIINPVLRKNGLL
jgi:hypothetical protein